MREKEEGEKNDRKILGRKDGGIPIAIIYKLRSGTNIRTNHSPIRNGGVI